MADSHDTASIQAFFDGWDLYRRVIAHDYMFHQDIHQAIRVELLTRKARRILDLGCGDASVIAGSLQGLPSPTYTGVDLSPVALQSAEGALAKAGIPARLVEDDFLLFLQDSRAADHDVVIAGYSLHHLRESDVTTFFRAARWRLAPGGVLLVYDVIREHEESREAMLERNHRWRQQTWTSLATEDLAAIWAHVSVSDFPKSEQELTAYAREGGFLEQPQKLFEAPTGIHRLYAFPA